MDQSRSTAWNEVEYAVHDRVVSQYLANASQYRVSGWVLLGMLTLSAMIGIHEDSGRFGNLAALIGATTAMCWALESGCRKSAWIRTLELRIEDLRQGTGPVQ